MTNPAIETLRAYRVRLVKSGKLMEAKTVERCIVLVKQKCVGNFGEKSADQADQAGHAK